MGLASAMLTLSVAASKLAFSFTIASVAPKTSTKASIMSLTRQLEFRLV
jgi:hypothetical protein